MAKTKSHTDLASTATSSTSHVYASGGRSHSSRRQARPPVIGPSSTLLALLATVASSSSSADGRPLSSDAPPPDFLCPFLPSEYTATSTHQRRDESDDSRAGANRITSSSTRVRRVARSTGYVPDKYVQGDDGRWRKEHSWSLYGSSYCECTDSVGTRPETAAPEVDDQVDPTQIASPVTSTIQTPTDMSQKLPPGWTNSHSSKKDPVSSLILALSIVLAVVICVLIFGCVVWRRKWIPRHKDVEKRRKKRAGDDEESDSESEEKRRMRSQQRMWAKASARWKTNVRLSARRRRKRLTTASSSVEVTAGAPSNSAIAPSSRSSLSLASRPSSPSTDPEDLPTATVASRNPTTDGETPGDDEQTNNAGDSRDLSGSQQPPEYGDSGASREAREPTADASQRLLSEPGTPAVDYALSPLAAPPSPNSSQSPPRATLAAHVATDDKALLARMADFVSAPPSEDPSPGDPSYTAGGPSVPVIEELEPSPEDLQALDNDIPSSPEVSWAGSLSSSHRPTLSVQLPAPTYSREPSPHPLFPPPPSKVPLADPLFYEYPLTFEQDVLETEPTMGPSAPPFDYPAPSAPPADPGSDAVASAPPLIDEEEETILGLGHAHVPSLPDAAPAHVDTAPDTGAATVSSMPSGHAPPDYLP